jgi:large subunit ribosomal protein L25
MANTAASLKATTRNESGKGTARSLRRAGQIPAVIYGHNRKPETLTLEGAAFSRLLAGISSGSTILDVTVEGQKPVKALIREIQRHPLRATDILHVDLYEVSANEKITVEVAVHLVGTSDGVRNFGGVMDQVLHKLELKVLPADIPSHIDVDVTPLGIGKSIFVRDIKSDKFEILNDPRLPICSCVAPRTEEVATPAAAAETGSEPELIRKAKADADAEAAKA